MSVQTSLFASGPPQMAEPRFQRLHLDEASWVEVAPGWIQGADALMESLVCLVPWCQSRRWMYDRVVDDPRLSCRYAAGDLVPHPLLGIARSELSKHYGAEFGSVGLNYYRDGRDSVAFHRDRELRNLENTLVAILTLGGPRPFRVRPLGGGPATQLRPGSGDLLVMGGACQVGWEHSVPKVKDCNARISISWRWSAKTGRRRQARPA